MIKVPEGFSAIEVTIDGVTYGGAYRVHGGTIYVSSDDAGQDQTRAHALGRTSKSIGRTARRLKAC